MSYKEAWQQHLVNVASEHRSDERIRIPVPQVRSLCESILVALGQSKADAHITTDVFMQSDLRGEESHGIRLLLYIFGRIKEGGELPVPKVDVIKDRGAVAVWDAHHSNAQVVAERGMRRAIEKAREFGIGSVGIRNANSFTSPKYYALQAVEAGMVGVVYTNSPVRMIAPHGGRTPLVGNNPIAIAAPAGKEFPFLLDMACTTVAMERVFQAHEAGLPIPNDWALDEEGNPTTDPAKALLSQLILPFGGYKAVGLALGHEVLTSILMGGALFGGGSTGFIPFSGKMNVSQHIMAINIDFFDDLESFKERMDEAHRQLKASKLRAGVTEVFMPGERGILEEKARLKAGLPLSPRVLSQLDQWASDLGLDTPKLLPESSVKA